MSCPKMVLNFHIYVSALVAAVLHLVYKINNNNKAIIRARCMACIYSTYIYVYLILLLILYYYMFANKVWAWWKHKHFVYCFPALEVDAKTSDRRMVQTAAEQRYAYVPAIYIYIYAFYSKTRANTPPLLANASVTIIASRTEAAQ